MRAIPVPALDAILALQLLVAWAGESSRLGWWPTNFIDPDAGLDLLGRIAPRTGATAGWELVRSAAIAVDGDRRRQQADGDRVVTLFHMGLDVDEALTDRLRELKASGAGVRQIPGLPAPGAPFDRSALARHLGASGAIDVETMPNGRRIKGDTPVGQEVRAKRLAAALLPLGDRYPLPYYRP